MHSRGTVADMASYAHAEYGEDVTGEVCSELAQRVTAAEAAGVAPECIVVDPGIGFSKRTEHSLTVLRELPRVADLGYPVLVGVSRKRVIGELSGTSVPAERDPASTGAHVYALLRGARLFRVHDVRAARQALDVAWGLMPEHERVITTAGRR
jgi:dihydropteroate synthase